MWEINYKGEGVMNKRHVFYVGLVLLAVVALFGSPLAALALHPGGDVQLKYYNGSGVATPVGTAGNIPYSPKATCGLAGTCHIESGSTPTTGGHNYGSGTAYSTHVTGKLGSDGNVYWQAYQNKAYASGVSVGRHMNEGRNEEYTNADRAAVGDPFFTSSLGMWGKY